MCYCVSLLSGLKALEELGSVGGSHLSGVDPGRPRQNALLKPYVGVVNVVIPVLIGSTWKTGFCSKKLSA
ncbi:unnamed protein product [Larinioides sclopetarius]|uniref:Uncharacterized protein n=1 Tax=Larinioides sclopetarius TaxID=280406 RepID=A0AAV2B8N3_9ARAC